MVLDNLRERIARLSPAKRALFELQLLKRGGEAGRAIPRREVASPSPLSFGQHRLWFLEQLEPDSFIYNEPKALCLVGQLDVDALRRAVETIVARHEILRTTFHAVDGNPVQVIADSATVDLPVVDVPPGAESARAEAVNRAMSEEIQRPFDLERGPLLRTTLLRMSPTEHILVVVVHHIIWDGWAARVFFQELGELYGAYRAGRPPRLPRLPIQYADFAVWQRQRLEGPGLDTQIRYWTDRLAGAPGLLDLPTDRPRPARQTHRGAWLPFTLPKPLSDAVTTLSRRHGATTFMTLLAALQTVLSRYTGQDDVVVGSPIARRTRSELEGLVGFFANTLALRTDLSGDPTFVELLGRVRDVALGAYEHQDVPFERLVEELHPERDLSRSPVFQVTFGLQSTPPSAPDLVDVAVEVVSVGAPAAKFDLTLLMHESPHGLAGRLEYSTDLFDAETVTRLLRHFQTLLEGVVADPDRPISRLPLLAESERRQILVEWNDTEAAYPRDRSMHKLFEEQARKNPNAVAIIFQGQSLTYAELNRRANQVAHHLKSLGMKPEAAVGICMERSVEMIVGLLGILKAGGAYVPLEPAYPKARLALLLKDTRSRIVLTQEWLAPRLPRRKLEVVCLDVNGEALTQEPDENTDSRAGAESLAYISYTSGSTGAPKGIGTTHRNVVRLVRNTNYAELNADEVLLQFAPLSFDASTFEIWGALLNGGRLVIFPPELPSLEELGESIRRHGVTTLWLTTGLFHQMIDGAVEHLSGVKQLLTGGDVLSMPHAERALRALPGRRLINCYGPTEGTTFTTWHQMAEANLADSSMPIGRPVANTTVYVLDRQLEPVPVGVPGELYVGGDGLARGYLNQPELTAERFIPDPFADAVGSRLYKSGDLVRWRPDGAIEFLGRIDTQLKVRGFRVEPGEVETVLVQHPDVREALVIGVPDRFGDKALVTYVVPRKGSVPEWTDLRRFLKRTLPEYMLPSTAIMLDALPLLSSGKVDRSALPLPTQARAKAAPAVATPRNTLELQLAALWQSVLGVGPIGITDDFFDLGGHSLLAVRLFAEIEKLSGKRLPIATIFQAPTVEQLARVLEQEGWTPPWSSLVPIQSQGTRPPFFCVHPGGGSVLSFGLLARYLGSDQPFYALQPRGLDGIEQPHERVEDMAAYYVEQIRTVQPDGPYLLGGRCFGGMVAFEMAQQLRAAGQDVASLLILDSGAPKPIDPSRQNGERRPVKFWDPMRDDLNATHARASRRYRARTYPGPITLIRSEEFTARIEKKDAHIAGWSALAVGGLESFVVPGSHVSMFREPDVQILAERLRACLEVVQYQGT